MRWWMLMGCVACTPDVVSPVDGEPEWADWRELVDPFIGTGGEGAEIANINPGASHPLGMTLVGPDTRLSFGAPSFYHCAGYWWHDTHIGDFSLTHTQGMGVPDYGTVPFMPRNGWDPTYTHQAGRAAPLDHELESASPGHYSVTLPDHQIDVELAATLRGAHARFRFPAGADPVVVFDLAKAIPGGEIVDAWAEWSPGEGEVTGFQRAAGAYSGRFGGLMTHFSALFDPAPIGGGGWNAPDAPEEGLQRVDGADAGFWLAFPSGTEQVDLSIAISYVDHDGAVANREAEIPDFDLEARVTEAEHAWDAYLGSVQIAGGTRAQQRIFYTALYHSLIFPSRQDDVDGRYRGLDQAIHTADGPHYSDLSMWDTFRTVHPWYTLVWPDLQADVNRSMVRMIEDGGYLPKWPLAHGYTGGMVGSPAMQVFAGSWLKGVRGFDVDTAWEAAVRTATEPVPQAGRGGLADYQTLGFVPMEDGGGSVSDTLEYAWNDHAMALWGEALGKPEAAALKAQSEGWPGIWDEAAGFFVGHWRDGRSAWEDNPTGWYSYYVEGNAWHYLWYIPYDIDRMIDVQHGGDRAAFHERYETYWQDVFAELDDLGPDDFYWHGNEPVMHYAYLGSLSGRPDLSADPARFVMSERYADEPIGLDGNDDAGTLSAWYLFSSLGLFPVAGTTDYALGSPIFPSARIHRPDGVLSFEAPGTSEARRYQRTVTVDGVPELRGTVDHEALLAGGGLVFELSETPVVGP